VFHQVILSCLVTIKCHLKVMTLSVFTTLSPIKYTYYHKTNIALGRFYFKFKPYILLYTCIVNINLNIFQYFFQLTGIFTTLLITAHIRIKNILIITVQSSTAKYHWHILYKIIRIYFWNNISFECACKHILWRYCFVACTKIFILDILWNNSTNTYVIDFTQNYK